MIWQHLFSRIEVDFTPCMSSHHVVGVDRPEGVSTPTGGIPVSPYMLPRWCRKSPVADFTVQEKNSRVIHHWGERRMSFYLQSSFGSTICLTHHSAGPPTLEQDDTPPKRHSDQRHGRTVRQQAHGNQYKPIHPTHRRRSHSYRSCILQCHCERVSHVVVVLCAVCICDIVVLSSWSLSSRLLFFLVCGHSAALGLFCCSFASLSRCSINFPTRKTNTLNRGSGPEGLFSNPSATECSWWLTAETVLFYLVVTYLRILNVTSRRLRLINITVLLISHPAEYFWKNQ